MLSPSKVELVLPAIDPVASGGSSGVMGSGLGVDALFSAVGCGVWSALVGGGTVSLEKRTDRSNELL
jgi:hypothetical protein